MQACYSLTVSKFAFIENGGLLQERSLGPKYQYFDLYGGSSFPRRRLFSTEEADFYYLELDAALQAIRKWSPHWANCHVCLHTDNSQTMTFLNKGSCKHPAAMDWLREIFWLSATYNFRLSSRHILGPENVLADRLSRLTRSSICNAPAMLSVD